MNRFRPIARLGLLFAGFAVALSDLPGSADPGEDATRKLIRDFSSEDPAVRDAASKKLVEAGPDVLPLLEAELAGGEDLEPEVEERLRACIERIRFEDRQRRLWSRPVEEDVAAWVKKHPCGCAVTKWTITEVEDERVRRWLPNARVYVFSTTCCKGRSVVRETLIIGREPDAVERTSGSMGLKVLKDHFKPVGNVDEAREAGDVAYALNLNPVFGRSTELIGAYGPKISVMRTNDGYLFEYGVNRVGFDGEGRLKNVEVVRPK